MIELVSSAAEKAVPTAPLLELGGDGWTLGANDLVWNLWVGGSHPDEFQKFEKWHLY